MTGKNGPPQSTIKKLRWYQTQKYEENNLVFNCNDKYLVEGKEVEEVGRGDQRGIREEEFENFP